MRTSRAASDTIFSPGTVLPASRNSSIWSAQGGLPSALLPFPVSGLWSACRALPATRSCKPASAAPLLLTLLPTLSLNLVWGCRRDYSPCPLRLKCLCTPLSLALSAVVRLPAGGRALGGACALPGHSCACASCFLSRCAVLKQPGRGPQEHLRLPAGSSLVALPP